MNEISDYIVSQGCIKLVRLCLKVLSEQLDEVYEIGIAVIVQIAQGKMEIKLLEEFKIQRVELAP